MRYVVTRLDGDLSPREGATGKNLGGSYHVIDTSVIHRLIATYRTEEYTYISTARAHELAERLANEHAARLNG